MKILIPTLFVAIVTVGILMLLGVISFSKYSKEVVVPDSIVIAPDVEGMRQQEAVDTVKAANLNASISGNIQSDYISPGKIMTQTPVGGSFVDRNGTVLLMVSSGNGVVEPYNGISTVPYLVGDTRDAAIEKCKKAGLGDVTFEEVYDENVMAGLVISSDPEGGAEVTEGSPIKILISKGQESFPMPDVVGMDLDAAQKKLSDSGFVVSVEYDLSDTVPEDHVMSQSIAPNTPVYRGDKVTIVVATQEELVMTPNVVGHPQKDAEDTLKEAAFEVNVITSFDASVPAGYVINQNPEADTKQKKGTKVTIIVSKGPEPTPTPDPNATATQDPNMTLAPGVTSAPGTTPGANVTPAGQTYKVTFNANGGTCSEKERQVAARTAVGQLPSATKDYYSFDGWYTSANGGTKLTPSTVISSVMTVYAHWTEKPVSDWILADKVPVGAEIIDTKWTYIETETRESDQAEMDGWTFVKKILDGYGEDKKVYEDPTGKDVRIRNMNVEVIEVTIYMYYHNIGGYWDPELGQWGEYVEGPEYGPDYVTPYSGGAHGIEVDHELDYIATDKHAKYKLPNGECEYEYYDRFGGEPCPDCGKTDYWYLRDTYPVNKTKYYWIINEPIYTYHFKREVEKESTTDPTGGEGVSDVKKYVKYRSK
ncbi:MAG: PASTA domain-containing protein [Clostridiales bacterium]|nr:PASTA domain-containing protein [Clostridiales bacterium]